TPNHPNGSSFGRLRSSALGRSGTSATRHATSSSPFRLSSCFQISERGVRASITWALSAAIFGTPALESDGTQHLQGVGAEELRPHLIAQGQLGELGKNPLEAEPHREIAGIENLVCATGVGDLDDLLG